MITNRNPATGIAFGYIRADSIDSDLWDQITIYNGTNVTYKEALDEHLAQAKRLHEMLEDRDRDDEAFDEEESRQAFDDEYMAEEEVYEGEHEGVKYRTSWLGGAPHLFVFESPVIGKFQQCSPCVPNAANLDCQDPDGITGYDVPAHWRREDGSDD